jgi:hypothetical protein
MGYERPVLRHSLPTDTELEALGQVGVPWLDSTDLRLVAGTASLLASVHADVSPGMTEGEAAAELLGVLASVDIGGDRTGGLEMMASFDSTEAEVDLLGAFRSVRSRFAALVDQK